MERITESDVQILDCIYRQVAKVEVFKARLIKTGEIICMKKIYVENVMDATFIQTEFIAMATLQHDNIIKLRSASLGGNNREISHVLIFMEFFQRGDLEKFIQSRAKEGGLLPETEIIDWLFQLVNAYAFMQERGVAHRDIKPQNIFIDEQNRPKIGDLGSAIKKEGDSATLMGTPMYLSPKLREAFANQNSNTFNVPHDVFKSDVYSLGLTFLYLTSLISVRDLCQLANLDSKIDARINALSENFSKVKNILKLMLVVDEHFRPDFIELKEKIKRINDVKVVQVANKDNFQKGMTIQKMTAQCSICTKFHDEKSIYMFPDKCVCEGCINLLKTYINQNLPLTIVYDSSIRMAIDLSTYDCCKLCKVLKMHHKNLSCLSASISTSKMQGIYSPEWRCNKCPFEESYMKRSERSMTAKCAKSHYSCLICMNDWFDFSHEICKVFYSNALSEKLILTS